VSGAGELLDCITNNREDDYLSKLTLTLEQD
jgi:hypothetical protein